jgi:hypothetical protein
MKKLTISLALLLLGLFMLSACSTAQPTDPPSTTPFESFGLLKIQGDSAMGRNPCHRRPHGNPGFTRGNDQRR